ncbi:MAG: hypothetical protein ACOYID_02405 [Eubacteriales bacterium]|jgi:ElaB/YqjD/DUF883 family membrane-anchored ribosome-binding protein|nr:hypothetical protein [Clostridiales bacterium]
MPRGRKPKNAVRAVEEIDADIASVTAQIAELRKRLSALKKERVNALAAKEQQQLQLLGEKIRESGKTIEEWLKEIG